MFDKKSIDKIVKDTISAMTSVDVKTKSDEHLVIITFLMETGMFGVYYDEVPVRHGFMAMTFLDFKNFVYNKVKINRPLVEDIRNIALIDVDSDSVEDMFDALMYNIAFQVLIVWGYYKIHLGEFPRDIDAVASAYISHWDTQDTPKKEAISSLIDWLNMEID